MRVTAKSFSTAHMSESPHCVGDARAVAAPNGLVIVRVYMRQNTSKCDAEAFLRETRRTVNLGKTPILHFDAFKVDVSKPSGKRIESLVQENYTLKIKTVPTPTE